MKNFHPDHDTDTKKLDGVEMFRCWDGLFGCEQTKPVSAFHNQRSGLATQPTLCDQCLRDMTVTFGIEMRHVHILVQLRHQELSIIRQAKTLSRPNDISSALAVMAADKVNRLGNLTRAIIAAYKEGGREAVEEGNAVYHRWWFEQIGIKPPKASKVIDPGVISGAINQTENVLPVGDRK